MPRHLRTRLLTVAIPRMFTMTAGPALTPVPPPVQARPRVLTLGTMLTLVTVLPHPAVLSRVPRLTPLHRHLLPPGPPGPAPSVPASARVPTLLHSRIDPRLHFRPEEVFEHGKLLG